MTETARFLQPDETLLLDGKPLTEVLTVDLAAGVATLVEVDFRTGELLRDEAGEYRTVTVRGALTIQPRAADPRPVRERFATGDFGRDQGVRGGESPVLPAPPALPTGTEAPLTRADLLAMFAACEKYHHPTHQPLVLAPQAPDGTVTREVTFTRGTGDPGYRVCWDGLDLLGFYQIERFLTRPEPGYTLVVTLQAVGVTAPFDLWVADPGFRERWSYEPGYQECLTLLADRRAGEKWVERWCELFAVTWMQPLVEALVD